MKENKPFHSSSPSILAFAKSTADMKEIAVKELQPFQGKAIKVATRWKPNHNKSDIEETTESSTKQTEVVNIEMVNGSKVKLGFSKYKNLTFNIQYNP